MTVLGVFAAAGIIAGGLGLIGLTIRGGRHLWRLGRGLAEFLDDWFGTPARPGVEERPGVMARLARIEERQTTVEHELTTNNGSSLKDAVQRVEKKLDAHLESLED